jgi:DNA-directed RNA polymerase subunit omega
MARITVEDCLVQIPNRFLLVMIASKRTKQLYKGAQVLVENKSGNKKVVQSLREIAAGKVDYEIPARRR